MAVLNTELLHCQVPEFRVSYTITTDKFDALYKQLKPKGVTLTALLAKAAGVALAQHPVLYACESHSNSSIAFSRCHSNLPCASNNCFASLRWELKEARAQQSR